MLSKDSAHIVILPSNANHPLDHLPDEPNQSRDDKKSRATQRNDDTINHYVKATDTEKYNVLERSSLIDYLCQNPVDGKCSGSGREADGDLIQPANLRPTQIGFIAGQSFV